jgi:hypothetical protein
VSHRRWDFRFENRSPRHPGDELSNPRRRLRAERIDAIDASRDHGQTWDLDHRYILHHWVGHRKGPTAWWPSSQATSSVLLPDGSILTAFGTGYRCREDAQGRSAPRDVGLIQWRLGEGQVGRERRIRDAAADSDLRNWLDPRTGVPKIPKKTS